MSEDRNNIDASSEDGLFNDLIEDFKVDRADNDDASQEEKPRTMRDFSRFFEDATASGSGFESTIDSVPEENIDTSAEPETLDFTEPRSDKNGIITEPVTDEDGMIVIFDEEAGIDATGYNKGDIVEITDSNNEDEKQFDADEDLSDHVNETEADFSADSNIEDDITENDEPVPEASETIETSEIPEITKIIETTEIFDEEPSENKADDEKQPSFIGKLFPRKGDSVAEVIRKIVFLAAVGVFAGAGIMLASTLMQSKDMQEQVSKIEEKVTTTVATSVNESGVTVTIPPTTEEREEHNESVMIDFIEISSNVKGFIEIPACDIYMPVVQGKDNDYYLTHTYDDRKNKAGSIFIDYRCTVTEEYTSPNVILYGHNQEDGTMFGNLKYYKNNADFYKISPTVVFNTEYGIGDYLIFGYFVTNVHEYQDANGEVFHYHDYIETLADENTFNWYMNEVKKRNQIITPVDVKYGDKLLVLSTCSNEYSDSRFVVLARKLRDGEKISDYDYSSARLNPEAKQIDWSVIMSGETSLTESSVSESETTTESSTAETTTTVSETTEITSETTSETDTETTTEPTTTRYTGTTPSYTGYTGPGTTVSESSQSSSSVTTIETTTAATTTSVTTSVTTVTTPETTPIVTTPETTATVTATETTATVTTPNIGSSSAA